jgi:hypothetical protein
MRLIFAASLHVEEGRQVCVRIALGTPGATPNIPFVHPLELDVKVVVKLAPAVNLWERQLLVAPDDLGKLKVTGIVQEKVVDWKGAGGVNRHSLGRLSLEVLGAGSIRVLAPLRTEYNRGEVQRLTELSTIPCVKVLLEGEAPNVAVPERVLTNLLRQMQQGKHGGTVVFVPTETEDWKTCVENHDSATAADFLASAVREWLEQEPIRKHIIKLHDLARINRNHAGYIPDKEGWLDVSSLHLVERNLENAERLISALSCVDGAVVIDRALGIRGFGYRLTAPSSGPSDLKGVGTRHRSAMDFCRTVGGAIAFVVSQDGGVTLFSNNGPDRCDRIAVCLDPRRCDI